MKYLIKIVLAENDDPVVWRRISIPVHFNFHMLHMAIQAAMGWRDSHLYGFSEHGMSDLISITSPYDEESGIDARTVPIDRILLGFHNSGIMGDNLRPLIYIYDYGDHWEHHLYVEGVIHEAGKKAELLGGEGACPPEDCGSFTGFMDLKQSLRTGEVSQMHGESWIPWLKGMGYRNYDPDVFDVEKARKAVKRIG